MIERYIVVQDRMGELSSSETYYHLVIDVQERRVMGRFPMASDAQPVADALNLTAVVRERVAS